MVRSKAVNVLSHLNKEEFHKFEKLLLSPYFNANKNLIKLFKLLKKFYPGFTSPNFNKQKVFSSVYENESYNDEKLRKLFSDMYKELEKFLVLSQLENDRITYNKLLLRRLDVKKLDKLFLSSYKEADEFLDSNEFNYGYFLEKFLMQWNYVSYHLDRGEQRKIGSNVFERGSYSTLFYLCDLFLTLNDMTTIRNTSGMEFRKNLSEKMLENFNIEKFFSEIDMTDIPNREFIRIYYYSYLMNKNSDEEHYFYELEKYVFDSWDKFSRMGHITVITNLINYCIRKTLAGKNSFHLNLHKLYNMYIEHKLFIREENSYVRSDVFLKIINNYIYVDKIQAIQEVIDKNMRYLHPDHKDNMLRYYRAQLNFSNKKFNETLEELSMIKSHTELFIEDLKMLQLKSYYELKLFDEAIEQANNFRNFVSNHKPLSEQAKNRYLNFLKIYKPLLKTAEDVKNDFSIKQLKTQLDNINTPNKKWLYEKIDEFIG
jgi:hypothetical protein